MILDAQVTKVLVKIISKQLENISLEYSYRCVCLHYWLKML